MRTATLKTTVVAGLTAGTLDGFAAVATSGVPPVRVFQFIASGLLGPEAFEGGLAAAAQGLALHFLVATGAAAVYVAASGLLPGLVRRPGLAGPAYGIAIYAFMRFVVMPLSAIGWRTPSAGGVVRGIVIHVVCVGLPIALWSRYFLQRAAPDSA